MPTSQKARRVTSPSNPVKPGTQRVTVNPGKDNERSFTRSENQPLRNALGGGLADKAEKALSKDKDK